MTTQASRLRRALLLALLGSTAAFGAKAQYAFEQVLDLNGPPNGEYRDPNNKLLTGTEIIRLESHQGKVFAGNSYWGETTDPRDAAVFRLDSAGGSWYLDKAFVTEEDGELSRISASAEVTFTNRPSSTAQTSATALSTPEKILMVGFTEDSGGFLSDYPSTVVGIRRDWSGGAGDWSVESIGSALPSGTNRSIYSQIRAIGFHRDSVTGIDYVFVGGAPGPLGIMRGHYDAADTNHIKFRTTPELAAPSYLQRFMGFVEIGTTFHALTQRRAYKRNDGNPNCTDGGSSPCWTLLHDFYADTTLENTLTNNDSDPLDAYWVGEDDIRAVHVVDDVDNSISTGNVIQFTYWNHLVNYDPTDDQWEVELDIEDWLEGGVLDPFIANTTAVDVHYIQGQESPRLIATLGDGTQIRFIGIEIYFAPSWVTSNPNVPVQGSATAGWFTKQGFFIEQRINGTNVTYTLHEITPNGSIDTNPIARTRDFLKSPFSVHNGQSTYIAGYAPWFISPGVTRTGWVYRGYYAP